MYRDLSGGWGCPPSQQRTGRAGGDTDVCRSKPFWDKAALLARRPLDIKAEEATQARRRPPIYYGWWIVLIAFLSDFVQGSAAYAFPIFYKPMATSFGWSRTTVAFAPTLRTFMNAFVSPAIGRIVDVRGPRLVMMVGAVLVGSVSLAMAGIGEIWQYFLVYSVIGSVANVAEGNLVTQATVSKWFIRKRGRATAFSTMGVSAGGLIFTSLGTFILVHYGWRAGWIFLAALAWILLIPATFFMRRQPEDMGLLPDGVQPAPATPDAGATPDRASKDHKRSREVVEEVWTLPQAIRSPSFWLIVMAFNLGSLSISAVTLHQFNYITDKGFSAATAATVVSVYAFLAIVAKLIYGFVSEKVHIRYLTIICMVGGGIAISIFNFATTAQSLFIYAVVYGLTRGAFILVTPLAYANYFGRTFQGTIRGFSAPFGLISSAAGPLFGAWIYDHYGSYRIAFLIYSATFLIGAFLMLLAKPTKPPVLKRREGPLAPSETPAQP